jgi:hypothetical protein
LSRSQTINFESHTPISLFAIAVSPAGQQKACAVLLEIHQSQLLAIQENSREINLSICYQQVLIVRAFLAWLARRSRRVFRPMRTHLSAVPLRSIQVSLVGKQLRCAVLVQIHHFRSVYGLSICPSKLFSFLYQQVTESPRGLGTVGMPLALLLIEQMLKRVNQLNFLGD